MFEFYCRTRVKLAVGSRHELLGILQKAGWRRIGVMIDHNFLGVPRIQELLNSLQTELEACVIGQCQISEPTYHALDAARETFANQNLQAMVGIGGGSGLDMAKAMAVLLHNRAPALAYRGFDKMTEPVLPIIALPTTAGTGSEITPNASFIDTQEKRKLGINGEAIRPHYALLDPELTLSCPAQATISAAVDSVVHGTEAYVAKKTHPLARLFAREGVARVLSALPGVLANPQTIALRQEVMYGAFLSALALMHSGTGPAAAMSYPLSVHYHVPHGIGGAIFLPHVILHNVDHGYLDYADLLPSFGASDPGLSRAEMARAFGEKMLALWQILGLPRELTSVGLVPSKYDSLVSDVLALKGALEQNPVPFGEQEIRTVVQKFDGK